MDIQTGLVCVGIAVLSAVVLFVISMFGMKEKTYDEAIAEQRKMPEEHLLLGRSAKDKAKDKKQKKAGKKVKEKPSDREKTEQSEIPARTPVANSQEKIHVDFEEPEAEVVSERPPQKEELGTKGNRESVPKEITVVTQEVAKVITQTSNKNIANSKTASKPDKPSATALPKADKSLTPAPKVEKPAPVVPKVEKPAPPIPKVEKPNPPAPKVEKPSPAPVTLPEPPVVAVQQPQTSPQPAKERSRKKKSELATLQQMSGDRDGVNVSLLMPLVSKAELSRSEIQILIDLLLNKQQGSAVTNSEWFEGRQDPVVKLKKQLAEKEKSLLEEQEASQAVQNKLKELRAELNAERSRLTQSTRQQEEVLAAKTNEAQGLASRLQHLQDTHNGEKQTLLQQVQQLQAKLNEEHVRLRQVQDEHTAAQGALQQELLSQRQTLELHIAHLSEQRQEAEGVVEHLRSQLQEAEGVAGERVRQMDTQVLHLKESQQDLGRQVEELNLIRSDLERRLSAEQQRGAAIQYEVDELRGNLTSYAEINEKLTAQLAAAQELTLETQRLREDNDRLAAQVTHLSELQREAQQLREENESLAAQVTAMTERPAAEGRENGDAHYPEEQQDSYGKEDIALHDSIVKQKDSLLEELGEELKQKDTLLEKLKSELNTHKTEHHHLSEELEEQRRKNNETSQQVQQEEQEASKQLLQRIFPDIRIEEKVHEQWVYQFEQQAQGFLAELKARPQHIPDVEDHSEEVEELEKQMSQLQAMNAHYKTIIDDTEGMLNKLQSHIEQEEARWSQQLLVKESELEGLKEKLSSITVPSVEMQMKLQLLEKEKQELDLKYATAASCCEQLEVEKAQLSLEMETWKQEKSRELAKLKSLVQIGKDSLSQEQELTSQLQQQVDKLNGVNESHNVATNGPTSESSISEGGSVKK